MPRRSTRSTRSKTKKVDFSGVETSVRFPDDDYAAKLISMELGKSEGRGGAERYALTYEVTKGQFKGKRPMPYYCSLLPQALWNLRGTLEAHGIDVPDGVMDIDAEQIVSDANEVGITIEKDDSFDGKARSKVVDIFPLDDLDEGDDSGERTKASDDDAGDDDDTEDLDPDDIDEMDKDELEEVIDEFDLDVDLDGIRGIKKQRAAVKKAYEEDAGDEDEDDEDDEDDEGSISREDVEGANAKRLAEIVEEYDLDVELDGNIRKKRRTVMKALEEEDLLAG